MNKLMTAAALAIAIPGVALAQTKAAPAGHADCKAMSQMMDHSKMAMNHSKMDQAKAGTDQSKMDHSKMAMDHSKMDHSKMAMDHSKMDHSKMDQCMKADSASTPKSK